MSDYRILAGDVRQQLKTLPDESVHCVITSPPYWGLRDYGTATWDGGNADCDHVKKKNRNDGSRQGSDGFAGNANRAGHADMGNRQWEFRCGKCGATRIDSQVGLEPTPEQYVENMVEVFREVRRVLRADGTVFLNLGDSYFGGAQRADAYGSDDIAPANATPGLKPKDLVGIPWRVAFALQADGWWLRSDIIWSKPNPMPESVRDRPTKAHEYLFLLTKSARYYYDADAIAEPSTNRASGNVERRPNPAAVLGNGDTDHALPYEPTGSRNKRSVWTIATQPYPDAHFAVFPEALVVPCVKAGTETGGTVLDPFMGSGTVGVVCSKLGRNFVGIELNPEYVAMAEKRIHNAPLSLFAP